MRSPKSLKHLRTTKPLNCRLKHMPFIQNFTTWPTFLILWKCKTTRPFMLLTQSIKMPKGKWNHTFSPMSTIKRKLLNRSLRNPLKTKSSASLMATITLFWLMELQGLEKLILSLEVTKNIKKASAVLHSITCSENKKNYKKTARPKSIWGLVLSKFTTKTSETFLTRKEKCLTSLKTQKAIPHSLMQSRYKFTTRTKFTT